jgi:hypothetical protein
MFLIRAGEALNLFRNKRRSRSGRGPECHAYAASSREEA